MYFTRVFVWRRRRNRPPLPLSLPPVCIFQIRLHRYLRERVRPFLAPNTSTSRLYQESVASDAEIHQSIKTFLQLVSLKVLYERLVIYFFPFLLFPCWLLFMLLLILSHALVYCAHVSSIQIVFIW